MFTLAISTVGPACEAAILGPEMEIVQIEEMARGHDARLPIVVEQARLQANLDWPQIDRLAVVSGPGSFAGIRVGVAFAQGLGLALDRPILGVTALEALGAEPAPRTLAFLPARRRPPERTWWAQRLTHGIATAPPSELDEEQLIQAAADADHLAGASPPSALTARSQIQQPSAINAARLASRIEPGDAPARPIYVRPPDAAPMKPIEPGRSE